MGISIANPPSHPAVVYDKVHLMNLEVSQPIFHDDTLSPVYEVVISYRLYGISDGVRHYKGDTHEIVIKDFLANAITKAQVGDMRLLVALQSIEAAVAAIITDAENIETRVL